MNAETCQADVTRLLQAASNGDPDAMDKAMRRLYDALHRLAAAQLVRERRGVTLSSTMLVNEAWLQVFVDSSPPSWESSGHLLAVSARAMRQVLIDHARRRKADKRPQEENRLQLTEVTALMGVDVTADDLESALDKLAQLDPRQANIVDMRFFVGLSGEQIAAATGLSTATVQREWRMARAWLQRELAYD